ncbi:Sodium-dependent lysophosphatidylcholine symporter 1-B [Varanus komodoensis]|nr:Sodium-dependent lysophosphatidylcholine symporter 1-B [Varanus komodoensis]
MVRHSFLLLALDRAGQEATVRTGHGTTDWFKIEKGVRQGCILSPCLFNLYAEHIMRKVGLDASPVGIKIAGRNIKNLRYADDTTLMAESEEEIKSLLMRVKEESAKAGLKLNIKKTKIMASGPLTSWQIDGEEMEVGTDFIFLGSKITADGDCSQQIKRRLLLGRKAMANLESILKSRDITLPTKKESKKKLSVCSKVCYAIGGAPYQITGCALGFFLQIYLLDVAQLDPFSASIILFVGRAWDAVTDPLVGFFLSKTSWSRMGRLMPW